MQIGLYNHLNFPKTAPQAPAGNAAEGSDPSNALAPGAAKPGLGASVRALTPAQDAPGVILKLQQDHMANPGIGLANGLVYSNGHKADSSAQGSDTERMAQQHRIALERSQGRPSSLRLDKDGLLTSSAVPAADGVDAAATAQGGASPAEDFVSFAVHAMRDFADEQERLKAAAKQQDNASPSSLIARGLGDVQKLAARFKMFA